MLTALVGAAGAAVAATEATGPPSPKQARRPPSRQPGEGSEHASGAPFTRVSHRRPRAYERTIPAAGLATGTESRADRTDPGSVPRTTTRHWPGNPGQAIRLCRTGRLTVAGQRRIRTGFPCFGTVFRSAPNRSGTGWNVARRSTPPMACAHVTGPVTGPPATRIGPITKAYWRGERCADRGRAGGRRTACRRVGFGHTLRSADAGGAGSVRGDDRRRQQPGGACRHRAEHRPAARARRMAGRHAGRWPAIAPTRPRLVMPRPGHRRRGGRRGLDRGR